MLVPKKAMRMMHLMMTLPPPFNISQLPFHLSSTSTYFLCHLTPTSLPLPSPFFYRDQHPHPQTSSTMHLFTFLPLSLFFIIPLAAGLPQGDGIVPNPSPTPSCDPNAFMDGQEELSDCGEEQWEATNSAARASHMRRTRNLRKIRASEVQGDGSRYGVV